MNSSEMKKLYSDVFESHDVNVLEDYEEKKLVSYSEIFFDSLIVGSNSFGGYLKKNDRIRKIIVNEKRYITNKSFQMILSLSEHIPGPTSTQVMIAIAAIKTNSITGTFLGVFGYLLPGIFLSMMISSFVFYLRILLGFDEESSLSSPLIIISSSNYFQYYLQVIITGLNQGSLAILLLNGFDFSKQFANSIFHLCLIFASATLYYFFNSFSVMIAIMIVCGLSSLFKRDQDYIIGIEDFSLNLNNLPFIGTHCLIVYLLVYIFILLFMLYLDHISINFYLMERFFRMGSIVIGGGASVIPFILTEFSLEQLIGELEVLSGFSIISLLPGPVFNVACIVGTLINGPIAGLISTIMLFLPGALFILWSLPYVNNFKQMHSLQRFLSGLNCSNIGFIFTATFKLWIISCVYNPYTNWIVGSINFLMTGVLVAVFQVIEPFALLISSVFLLFVKIVLRI
jgi:chromate transporter